MGRRPLPHSAECWFIVEMLSSAVPTVRTQKTWRANLQTLARVYLYVSISTGSLFVGLLRSSLFQTLLLPKYLHTPSRNPYVVHELTRLAPRANTQTLARVYLHVSISTGSSFFGLLRSGLFRALLLPSTYILLPETHSSSTNLPDLLHARTRKPSRAYISTLAFQQDPHFLDF